MALDEALRRLHASAATTVLIDGRSGSGKSTLATQLRRHWAGSELVRLDDIYPGWDGLTWACDHVRTSLLQPRFEGRPGSWRSWDWTTGQAGAWHTIAPRRRLVVEGTGALTPASRSLADLAIWVEADDDARKQRALARDGDTYRPHWDRWAAQEQDFITRCDPRGNADLEARLVAGGFALAPAPETH